MLGQHRSTQRQPPRERNDEAAVTVDIVALARQYGRYGYRRITVLLRRAGERVNAKRIERIWRRGETEGAGAAAETRPAVVGRRVLHPAPA